MISSADVYACSTRKKTAIRIIKKTAGIVGIPNFKFDCEDKWNAVSSADMSFETLNEFVVYIEYNVVDSNEERTATIYFDTKGLFEVAAIICEKEYLMFKEENGHIQCSFEFRVRAGSTSTLYVRTVISEDGLVLRLEHNHPGRRAGMYATGKYPEKEIAAAHHYIFAMREIMKMMRIPEYLVDNNLGYVYILGFETNSDIHKDYPPHWHFIYRWPHYCGSQAPHLYLDEEGRTIKNTCYIDGIPYVSRTYETQEWCKFVDYYGHDLCAICVQEDGGILVTKPEGDVYCIGAYKEDGVIIKRNEKVLGRINVFDDTELGVDTIQWNGIDEEVNSTSYIQKIYYDSLTGVLKKIERFDANGNENKREGEK